jgi:hypothetical protein
MSRHFFDQELLTNPGENVDFKEFAWNVVKALKQVEEEYVDQALIQLPADQRKFPPEEWMEALCEEMLVIPKTYWEEED